MCVIQKFVLLKIAGLYFHSPIENKIELWPILHYSPFESPLSVRQLYPLYCKCRVCNKLGKNS